MSVGAVLAVAARPGLHLQVTSGERTDLVRVLDGTQRAITLGTNRIAMDRQIDLLRDTWSRYGYQEAADGFDALLRAAKQKPGSVDDAMLARLKFWAALGRSFAAWDRFDRRQAATGLRHPLRKAGPDLEKFGTWANALEANAAPLVLFDLMRNAERCAIRERHDDAVARCYRLWEWTAQWLLQAECDIRTDAVDPERLDAELSKGLTLTEERVYQIASDRAWRLYRQLRPRSEAALFWDADNEKAYRDHAYIRNYSILAHGYLPIDGAKSKAILAWTAGPFMEMVRSAARRLGQPDDMPQLPRDLPEPRQG
jgi:CRISPR-associated protein (TIGR02710 family)